LSASDEGEEAYESPALGHGVFTYFVLEGLRGAADVNGDLRVTLWELYEYVAAQVPVQVAAERNEPQHPQLRGEGETRVLLALGSPTPEVAFSYCPTIPYAGGTVQFEADVNVPDASLQWAFGDGTTSVGSTPSHVYADPGRYEVRVTAIDADNETISREQTIDIAPRGAIVSMDRESGMAVLSLGSRNGVRVGDRFVPERGGVPLEVIELVDEDSAVCSVGSGDVGIGDSVRPTKETPCRDAGGE
jgi:hypothetical protein